MVTVQEIQNGWGRIVYKGQTAYISLDYADFVSPLQYTVFYEAGDRKWQEVRFSFEGATAPDAPAVEGHKFLNWAANGMSFQAGEVLPAGDLSLTAVYEKIAPPAPEEKPDTDAPPAGDAPLLPEIPPVGAPELPMPLPPSADAPLDAVAADKAAAHAGVVSGVLSAIVGLWWYVRRFLS
jgi:hypothetical protein